MDRLPVSAFALGVVAHAVGRAYHFRAAALVGAAIALGALAVWLLAQRRPEAWVAPSTVLVCAGVLVWWDTTAGGGPHRLIALTGAAVTAVVVLLRFPRRTPVHFAGAVVCAVALVAGPVALRVLADRYEVRLADLVAAFWVPLLAVVCLAVAVVEAAARVPRRPAVVGVALLALYGGMLAVGVATTAPVGRRLVAPPRRDAVVAVVTASRDVGFDTRDGGVDVHGAVAGVLVLVAVAMIVTVGVQDEPPPR